MGKIRIECEQWDCDGVVVEEGDPKPINHSNEDGEPCDGPLLDSFSYLDDEDEEDEGSPFPSPTKNESPRPSWYKVRRKELKTRATSPGGTLFCQLCKKPIDVNHQGKETWVSASGKRHQTSPHVDHFGTKPLDPKITGGVKGVKGDWVERKAAMRNSATH
ncbi:MAG: hypothetical protein ACREEV_10235, partial [Dongiaceae bacterium]